MDDPVDEQFLKWGLDQIVAQLLHPDLAVRKEAVRGISACAEKIAGLAPGGLARLRELASDSLILLLSCDEDPWLRHLTIDALGALEEVRVLETLVAILEKSGEDMSSRHSAATALGHLRDPRAIAPLIGVLERGCAGAVDFLIGAASALAKFEDSRAQEYLSGALERAAREPFFFCDPGVNLAVAVALSRRGSKEAQALLDSWPDLDSD